MVTHLVAVGDIHGHYRPLLKLVRRVRNFMLERGLLEQTDWNFVFLGDYIDRGPESRKVVDRIRQFQEQGAVCLIGNHEDIAVEDRAPYDDRTLESYGGVEAIIDPNGAFHEHLRWFGTLPLYHRTENHLFVHAGVRPDVPLDEQLAVPDKDDLLWIREPFLSATRDFGAYVVHGHTVTREPTPDIRANRCNLDTGAGYGLRLSAAAFDLRQREPIQTFYIRDFR